MDPKKLTALSVKFKNIFAMFNQFYIDIYCLSQRTKCYTSHRNSIEKITTCSDILFAAYGRFEPSIK